MNAEELQTIFLSNKLDYELLCGEPLNRLEVSLELAIDAFHELLEIGQDTVSLLICEDINQIYVDVMHDAMCTSAPTVLGWIFSSMISIYAGGMLIIILRGALLPTESESNDGTLPMVAQDNKVFLQEDDRKSNRVYSPSSAKGEDALRSPPSDTEAGGGPDKMVLPASETEIGDVPDEMELLGMSDAGESLDRLNLPRESEIEVYSDEGEVRLPQNQSGVDEQQQAENDDDGGGKLGIDL